MINIDHQLFNFLVANRNGFLTTIFSFFSFLGNWQFIVLGLVITIVILLIKKKITFIGPLLLSVISSDVFTFLAKLYFRRTRPVNSIFLETGFSFPSGHATVAVAFYGFLAFMIWQLSYGRRSKLIYAIATLIILMIGLSRVYLGAHYLSDVLIGYIVGLGGLVLGVKFFHLRKV